MIKIHHLLTISLTLLLTACGGESPTDSVDNLAPVISGISNQYINKNSSKSVTVNVTDTGNDTLEFSVTSSNSNLSAVIANDTLTLTPASDWSGTSDVTVTVSDGELSDSATVIVTVLEVSSPPTLTITNSDIPLPPSIPIF